MTAVRHDTVLKVVDIVGHPGSSRPLDLALGVPDQLDLPVAEVSEPVLMQGVIESVVEGLLVRGALSAALRLECARCLEPLEGKVRADFAELFSDPDDVEDADAIDPGYEIAEGTIDVVTLLRDTLVPSVPLQPLCQVACAGLCPTCGANWNQAECGCADEVSDPRWQALQQLDLPD